MDKQLSWRAQLARKNINILGIDKDRWYYEFMYHPRAGQTKWSKTFYTLPHPTPATPEIIATEIQSEVLSLRKELEN